MTEEAQPQATRPEARSRRTLWLIAAVALAPVLLSYTIYYVFPREAGANYGTLLPTAPAPAIAGTASDGTPFRLEDLRGRWVLLAAGASGCDTECEQALYATRQARAMQGKDQDRIVRVWLDAGGDAIAAGRMEEPGLVIVRVSPAVAGALPQAGKGIVLLDPLGNMVLAYPAAPDIKGLAKDLARLLRASRIG